jgi:amino-acid N-acetyltransferase
MNIYPVTQNDFTAAINLLKQNNLPTEDITDTTPLFTLYNEGVLIGVIGLEIRGEDGLLRSLCVDESKRTSGSGKHLVSFIENYAKEHGVKNLYLLTTTAAPFFTALSYETIDRHVVPPAIRETSEFASVCPASATVMRKKLVHSPVFY